MRSATTVLFAVILAALVCSSGAAGRAAAPAGGAIQLFVTPNLAPNSPLGRIVITGAIGDSGTTLTIDKNGMSDPHGDYLKVILKKGTFTIDATAFTANAKRARPTFNTATCSGFYAVSGPLTLSTGTGLYAGITGTVKITETFAFILPTHASGAKKGQCNTSSSAQPMAQYAAVIGTGMVTFS